MPTKRDRLDPATRAPLTPQPTYIPPYDYEDRINLLAAPYLANIRATAGRGESAPELVHVNSGMWDVVRYSHEDASAGADLETPLSA